MPHCTRWAGVFATLLALGVSTPGIADIWGYVDEQGVAHLSDRQVNERYYLFKKEAPRPKAEEFDPALLQSAVGNIQVNAALRTQYSPLIAQVAREYDLDPYLLHAIITVESGYNAQARSPKGATGLMQLIPETAQRYAVKNIADPLQNLQGGARYLRFLLGMFPNRLDLVLAAYNAGENAVVQYGNKIPPYAETVAYVPNVLLYYERYRSAANNATGGVIPVQGTQQFRERQPLIR